MWVGADPLKSYLEALCANLGGLFPPREKFSESSGGNVL